MNKVFVVLLGILLVASLSWLASHGRTGEYEPNAAYTDA